MYLYNLIEKSDLGKDSLGNGILENIYVFRDTDSVAYVKVDCTLVGKLFALLFHYLGLYFLLIKTTCIPLW